MLKLFQKLTKKLSIRSIVILGVFIMAIVITAFAFTMNYLSSTIKYDQETLKRILELEKQNQEVLKNINDINQLENKILLTKEFKKLETLEKELFSNVSFNTMKIQNVNSKLIKTYNEKVDSLSENFNSLIFVHNAMFESKSVILFYLNELQDYKEKIDTSINKITNESESIYGKASLFSKRYNRKIRKNIDINSLDLDYKGFDSQIIYLGKIMTLSKDLDSSILKLPNLVYEVKVTNNVDVINSIDQNSLKQLVSLLDNTLTRFTFLEHKKVDFVKSVELIKDEFMQIKDILEFFITMKKQLISEENRLNQLVRTTEYLNTTIYKEVNNINEISNEIKLEILNHSDNISKKTTITIVIVGVISFFLIFLSAITLISRINLPLQFIIKFMDNIINQKKSLSSNIPIFTDDEFGKLSNSFNNMTTTISKNIHEIEYLNKEIENTQKEVIFTMGAIGESRSKETGNHVKRVAEYSRILALLYGLEKEEAELLKEASPMHDIGKVGIPDAVLKKPSVLNDHEWLIMKSHAQLGYEMLKHSNRTILKAAAIVAREHHEKWDGSGYPRGLKGEDIHIYGRITAVADVFDALGSDRCYKQAWPLAEIKEFFIDQRAKHFDPKLVDLFMDNLDEFLEVRDKYKDVFD